MSTSSRPTCLPASARATARFTATVLLPTPPFPEATAIVFFTPGSTASSLAAEGRPRVEALISTSAFSTPSRASTRSLASRWNSAFGSKLMTEARLNHLCASISSRSTPSPLR